MRHRRRARRPGRSSAADRIPGVELAASPTKGSGRCAAARRHFTHSKMMAWVAFDRAVKAVERFGLEGRVDRWRAIRDEIHREVCARGLRRRAQRLRPVLRLDRARRQPAHDAAGRLSAGDRPARLGHRRGDRARADRDGLRASLSTAPRSRRPAAGRGRVSALQLLAGGQPTSARAATTRRDELFERLLALRNDVGLLSEEYDPHARRMVGNFPQAFSHLRW